MKKIDWILCITTIVLAQILNGISSEINHHALFPSWPWLLGFILQNASGLLLVFVGIFIGWKITKKYNVEA